jgi:phosphoribosylformylglycinamidine synthase
LTSHPNIASKRWVYEQYDTMVGTKNMSTNKPSDAGIANLKGTDNAIAMTCDCNSRYVYSDPFVGTQIAVSEAARNIVCSGGDPLAVTNCLNFGNPYNENTYWQFVKAIEGMSTACRKFNTPVTGGNVSFYNQAVMNGKTEAVYPSPVIGMVGTVDKSKQMTMDFKTKGATIYMLGEIVDDINCSEYLYSYKGVKLSPAPYFNLEKEANMQRTLSDLINQGVIESAHDISEGGLFIAVLESAMIRNMGFEIYSAGEVRLDSFLFGESQGRAIVTVCQGKENEFFDMLNIAGVNCCAVGNVRDDEEIIVDEEVFGKISKYKQMYDNTIGDVLDK